MLLTHDRFFAPREVCLTHGGDGLHDPIGIIDHRGLLNHIVDNALVVRLVPRVLTVTTTTARKGTGLDGDGLGVHRVRVPLGLLPMYYLRGTIEK